MTTDRAAGGPMKILIVEFTITLSAPTTATLTAWSVCPWCIAAHVVLAIHRPNANDCRIHGSRIDATRKNRNVTTPVRKAI
jgi:hypothetical protein